MTERYSRNNASPPHNVIAAVLESIFLARDPRQILAIATEQVGQYFEAARCLALIGNAGKGGKLLPVEWCSFDPDPSKDKISVSLASAILDKVRERSESIIVNDVRRSTITQEFIHELAALNVKGFLATEIKVQSRSLGCLILYHCVGGREFSDKDAAIVLRLCNIIGTAVSRSLQEQSLHRTIERYQSAFNEVIDGISQYDSSGRLLYINRSFEKIFGREILAFRGRSFLEVISRFVANEDQRSIVSNYSNAIRSRKPVGPFDYQLSTESDGKLNRIQELITPLFDSSGRFIGIQNAITAFVSGHSNLESSNDNDTQYHELVEQVDAVIIKTDKNFNIRFVNNRCVDIFGVSKEDLLTRPNFPWYDLVDIADRDTVIQKAQSAAVSGASFETEFRISIGRNNESRWFLAKFVAAFFEDGSVGGWDGYAVDITERKKAQDVLNVQVKKVKALYTVSSAIRGYLDPANIAYRGLAALTDATNADAGVCFLYSNDSRQKLKLVSHIGFSSQFVGSISEDQGLENIVNYVARYGKSVIVPDIKADPRVSQFYHLREGLASAVLSPISVDDETLGTIGLFSKKEGVFRGGDVMLVSAAANQIGLAARQAQLFSAYKRQTKTLAALYRISHELSSNLSLDEIFQRSFTVIREELGIKRFWLGLLNDVGTRIVGQAAYGPGWKRQLVQMNIDISGTDHPFGKVVNDRKALVLTETEATFERFGLKRVFSRLAIDSVILVPLIGGGQVLGLIAIQPRNDERLHDEEDIALLSNLANEIGAVVLTKQLEQRISDADRMRTAGILAAGIAHNFNNLLQAILGQASLLEMQSQNDQKVERAAKIIHQAAVKGAGLVKQLVSFAQLEEPKREICDVNVILARFKESFMASLKEIHSLEVKLEEKLPRVDCDPGQIIRIISGLVFNAVEAMPTGGKVQIETDLIVINKESPHYEVPFGTYVRIMVRDSGIGMDAETKRRCFEPFYTTKALDRSTGLSTAGAGLGLAAAYALAQKNGGRLLVESRLGFGSQFTIYLPVAKAGVGGALSQQIIKEASSATEILDSDIEEGPEIHPSNTPAINNGIVKK